MDPSQQTRQEGGRQKTQRFFLCNVNEEQYKTLLQLAEGTFKVPRSKQMKLQKNSVRQYQMGKADFHVASDTLYFQGKQVVTTSHARQAVKSTFKRNLGSASRSTWQQMKRTRASVSFEMVKRVLNKSRLYQRHRPMFKNKVPPKPVRSGLVNERWQIDLIDMHSDEMLYEEKPQRYFLSIIDTFSHFLLLRSLASVSVC